MHYVIGDLHGQLPALKLLLQKIKYVPGADYLYFLGDYVDWGCDSIGTLAYVMQLEEQSDRVTALLGNHDQMMLENITNRREMLSTLYHTSQWKRNRGDETLAKYLKLPEERQKEIKDWLLKRPADVKAEVYGQKFYLCHGIPLCVVEWADGGKSAPEELLRAAVWYRPIPEEEFCSKIPQLQDCRIIRGHSITESREVEIWENGLINIDCGAKVFYVDLDKLELGEEEKKKFLQSKLAAFCLEDESVVYVTLEEFRKRLQEEGTYKIEVYGNGE